MQIKVTDTRMHTYPSQKPYQIGVPLTCPVAEGKLVLIKHLEDGKPECIWLDNVWYKPIIISETEKIEEGNLVYSPKTGFILQVVNKDELVYGGRATHINTINTLLEIKDSSRPYKVLAIPEQFSPKHLQAIVDGKMKDGDKVLVECEKVNWEYYGLDDQLKFTDKQNVIKLNSQGHVTLHKVEEKLYTRDQLRR